MSACIEDHATSAAPPAGDSRERRPAVPEGHDRRGLPGSPGKAGVKSALEHEGRRR